MSEVGAIEEIGGIYRIILDQRVSHVGLSKICIHQLHLADIHTIAEVIASKVTSKGINICKKLIAESSRKELIQLLRTQLQLKTGSISAQTRKRIMEYALAQPFCNESFTEHLHATAIDLNGSCFKDEEDVFKQITDRLLAKCLKALRLTKGDPQVWERISNLFTAGEVWFSHEYRNANCGLPLKFRNDFLQDLQAGFKACR